MNTPSPISPESFQQLNIRSLVHEIFAKFTLASNAFTQQIFGQSSTGNPLEEVLFWENLASQLYQSNARTLGAATAALDSTLNQDTPNFEDKDGLRAKALAVFERTRAKDGPEVSQGAAR